MVSTRLRATSHGSSHQDHNGETRIETSSPGPAPTQEVDEEENAAVRRLKRKLAIDACGTLGGDQQAPAQKKRHTGNLGTYTFRGAVYDIDENTPREWIEYDAAKKKEKKRQSRGSGDSEGGDRVKRGSSRENEDNRSSQVAQVEEGEPDRRKTVHSAKKAGHTRSTPQKRHRTIATNGDCDGDDGDELRLSVASPRRRDAKKDASSPVARNLHQRAGAERAASRPAIPAHTASSPAQSGLANGPGPRSSPAANTSLAPNALHSSEADDTDRAWERADHHQDHQDRQRRSSHSPDARDDSQQQATLEDEDDAYPEAALREVEEGLPLPILPYNLDDPSSDDENEEMSRSNSTDGHESELDIEPGVEGTPLDSPSRPVGGSDRATPYDRITSPRSPSSIHPASASRERTPKATRARSTVTDAAASPANAGRQTTTRQRRAETAASSNGYNKHVPISREDCPARKERNQFARLADFMRKRIAEEDSHNGRRSASVEKSANLFSSAAEGRITESGRNTQPSASRIFSHSRSSPFAMLQPKDDNQTRADTQPFEVVIAPPSAASSRHMSFSFAQDDSDDERNGTNGASEALLSSRAGSGNATRRAVSDTGDTSASTHDRSEERGDIDMADVDENHDDEDREENVSDPPHDVSSHRASESPPNADEMAESSSPRNSEATITEQLQSQLRHAAESADLHSDARARSTSVRPQQQQHHAQARSLSPGVFGESNLNCHDAQNSLPNSKAESVGAAPSQQKLFHGSQLPDRHQQPMRYEHLPTLGGPVLEDSMCWRDGLFVGRLGDESKFARRKRVSLEKQELRAQHERELATMRAWAVVEEDDEGKKKMMVR